MRIKTATLDTDLLPCYSMTMRLNCIIKLFEPCPAYELGISDSNIDLFVWALTPPGLFRTGDGGNNQNYSNSFTL